MAFDRFLIGPLSVGLQTDLKPFMIAEEAFTRLQNAYVFRGRVRKRFGSRLMGVNQLVSRLRVSVGTTDGLGALAGTVPGNIFSVGQTFSIGTKIYTVSIAAAGPQNMLQDGTTTTATYDITNGNFNFVGAPALTIVYFYPDLPVMGFTLYESGPINDHPLYAFDRQFAYKFTAGWARSGTAVWHGTDSDFFWSTNWQGATDSSPTLFVSNFFVVNKNGAVNVNDDPLWTTSDGATWAQFTPKFLVAGAGNFVKTARIVLPFRNRLVLLNTIETDAANANNINYPNRCRFSQNGSPFEGGLPTCTTAWLEQNQTGSHQAGFIDATTDEEIVSAGFIKDRLIVYFERSTWELAYTGNEVQPFIWQKLNTELGSQSTFSSVPFDKNILTVGNTGVHACNGSNVLRTDAIIPDQIFKISTKNNNENRVAGIRDYFTELVYWSYLNTAQENSLGFPNKVLVYNYQNAAWGINDDCITAFGYFEQQTGLTWQQATYSWESTNEDWESGTLAANFRQIVGGNQQGFTFIIDAESSSNAAVMYITDMNSVATGVRLTIRNHTVRAQDFISLSADYSNFITGNGFYKVLSVVDAHNIIISATLLNNYIGGVFVARVSQIDILTKQWNFYQNVGKNVYIQKVDFNVTKTSSGQITVDYFPSSTNESMIIQAAATGSAMGTSVLETSPYDLVPLEEQQERLWHPVYFQTEGETVQLRIYLDDTQMTTPNVATVDFEINAMVIYAQPLSRLQ